MQMKRPPKFQRKSTETVRMRKKSKKEKADSESACSRYTIVFRSISRPPDHGRRRSRPELHDKRQRYHSIKLCRVVHITGPHKSCTKRPEPIMALQFIHLGEICTTLALCTGNLHRFTSPQCGVGLLEEPEGSGDDSPDITTWGLSSLSTELSNAM